MKNETNLTQYFRERNFSRKYDDVLAILGSSILVVFLAIVWIKTNNL